jgi:hypothetical protein
VDSPTLATEDLESVLRGLDVLFKVTRFYPLDHPALKTAVEQTLGKCAPLLTNGQPLLLTIHKEGFTLGKTPLIVHNPVLKKFATRLFSRHVRNLAFLPDLSARDLQTFARCISQDAAEIERQGGAQTLLQEAGVATLWVNELDLSKIYKQKKEVEQRILELGGHGSETSADQQKMSGGQGPEKEEKPILEKLLQELERTESDQHFRMLAKDLEPLVHLNLTDAGRPQVIRALELLCRYAADRQLSTIRSRTAGEILALLTQDDILIFLVQSLCHKNLPNNTKKHLLFLITCFKGKIEHHLMQQISDEEDAQCRKIFGAVLIRLGASAVPVLVESLKDSRWFVVRNVIFILGEIRDQQTADSLVPTLTHEDLRVRRETIRALTKIGGGNAEKSLLQVLASDDREMRRQAILSLGAMKCNAAVPPLLALATQKDRKGQRLEEKKEAINALGQIGNEEANSQLKSILKRRRFWFPSKNDALRVAAAQALGKIGSPDSLTSLQHATEDRSETVARAARLAIQQIKKTAPYAS